MTYMSQPLRIIQAIFACAKQAGFFVQSAVGRAQLCGAGCDKGL
jgi:hypothetical protein